MTILIRILLFAFSMFADGLLQAQQPLAPDKRVNLLADPQWQEGLDKWQSRGVTIRDESDRHVVVGPDQGVCYLSQEILAPPGQVMLQVTFQYRATQGENNESLARLTMGTFDRDRSRVPTGFSVCLQPTGDSWKTLEATYVLPRESKALRFSLVAAGHAQLDVKDVEIRSPIPAGHPAVATRGRKKLQPDGPAVLRAYAGTSIAPGTKRTGVVTFPIPNAYAQQIPLSFAVNTRPKEAFKSFRWRKGTNGNNLLCEVTVEVPQDLPDVDVSWESYVFVDSRSDAELPQAEVGPFPDDVQKWTRSTKCVQSDDSLIQAKANELFESAESDIQRYVESVIAFTHENRGQDKDVPHRGLDAVQGITCGGSCTNRANLCAALLRARGIPARTQSHLPVWADQRLYQHWLVEYWHPGIGWIWLESTRGQLQPAPWSLVVLHVSEPDDEDFAFDESIPHSGVVPGVAKWSVHNIDSQLRRSRSRNTRNGADLVWNVRLDQITRSRFVDIASQRFAAVRKQAFAGDLPSQHESAFLDAMQMHQLPDFPANQ